MKIENHIQDILQLYEFGMTIGKTVNYKESCDSFLKLLLKRKNLNAAYILEHNDEFIKSTYSIPLGENINVPFTDAIKNKLTRITNSILIKDTKLVADITPINIKKGSVAIFNIENNSYLLLYTNKDNLTDKDLSKLKPIINKFSISLEACRTFEKQEKLLQDLKVQNQELNDYAQLVSHDLKSPIQSIEALTSWVIQDYSDVLDATGKQNLRLIKENVEKMDTLVKGILEYATIDKIEKEDYNIDVNILIKEVFSTIKTTKKVNFKIVNYLPTIKGNSYRFQLLFYHLIKNAIQFNNKETVTIAIGSKENDRYWQFYVKDNGKGIEKKYFDKIFTAFQKLEDNYQSTGIGLSTVKKIIAIYEGDIWLESEINKGTTFHFTLKK